MINPLHHLLLIPGSKVVLTNVMLASLGLVQSAILRLEATGGSTQWEPATLDLSGMLFSFPDTATTAPGTATGTVLVPSTYEIRVHCSDIRGNGTDGDLSVTLVGDKGSSAGEEEEGKGRGREASWPGDPACTSPLYRPSCLGI